MNKNRVIYTVCTIENLGAYPLFYTNKELREGTKTLTVKEIYNILRQQQSTRTVGFFFNIEDAIKCVEENGNDIYEGSYKHVVIEAMTEGPHPIPQNLHGSDEIWFEWQGSWEMGGYEKIDKPECTEKIINWGIG